MTSEDGSPDALTDVRGVSTLQLREVLRTPPSASSPATRTTMQGNARLNTRPERVLRSALHAYGLRYRVDLPIRLAGRRPIRPDIVFTRARVAVFVDGCFWHGCPVHGTSPQSNSNYWNAKLELNIRRDREQSAALEGAGWIVIRIWEHDAASAAAQVVAVVRSS